MGGFVGANGALLFPDGSQFVRFDFTRQQWQRYGDRWTWQHNGTAGRAATTPTSGTTQSSGNACDEQGGPPFCGGTLIQPEWIAG